MFARSLQSNDSPAQSQGSGARGSGASGSVGPRSDQRTDQREWVDATYTAAGPDELRRRAAEGDQRAVAEMARATA
jgi:hypothetical protein